MVDKATIDYTNFDFAYEFAHAQYEQADARITELEHQLADKYELREKLGDIDDSDEGLVATAFEFRAYLCWPDARDYDIWGDFVNFYRWLAEKLERTPDGALPVDLSFMEESLASLQAFLEDELSKAQANLDEVNKIIEFVEQIGYESEEGLKLHKMEE